MPVTILSNKYIMNHTQAVRQLSAGVPALNTRVSNNGSRLPVNPVAELARALTEPKRK